MRIRKAVPAAALLGCVYLASGAARAADAQAVWSGLWRTPDQQGQALLDAGQPAQAAARFHDPRRRAYADLEAGRYRDAAKLLAPFTDTESEYNLGNALAASGQLQAALAAYDAALKQAPSDKDIRHNRDLVERALRRQRQSSSSSSRNGGQNGRKSGSSAAGRQQQSGAGQRNGSGSQQSAGSSQQSGPGQRNGSGAQQSAGSSQQSGAGGQESSRQQAQRDAAAAAALARRQQQRSPGSESRSASNGTPKGPDSRDLLGGAQTPRQKPETERQLALDQWLRQIPDSPAGLLQRKFLIEHMMRQQESGNQGDGP